MPATNASRAASRTAAPSWPGSRPATSTALPRVSWPPRPPGRDAWGAGRPAAAVDGHPDRAHDGDPEGAAELGPGLADARGGAGLLGRGRANDQLGGQPEHRGQPQRDDHRTGTRGTSPSVTPTWEEQEQAQRGQARPPEIT